MNMCEFYIYKQYSIQLIEVKMYKIKACMEIITLDGYIYTHI